MARTKSNVVAFRPNKPVRRKINLRTPLGKINHHWVEVVHERDPKQVIWDSIGKIPPGFAHGSHIVVAIYKPPIVEKTKGGIILTQAMSEEDVEEYYWMGKVGLVVAMGPQAYMETETLKFYGRCHIGDWVRFMPSHGQAIEVNETFCRDFETERFISGTVPHPDYVW
jgi:hypothetical protein